MSKSEKSRVFDELQMCSWCRKGLQDRESSIVLLKSYEDITPLHYHAEMENNLSGYLGQGILITIRHLDKDIPAYVFSYDSEEFYSDELGFNDLGFLLCDEKCMTELNRAFEEGDVFFDDCRFIFI